MEQAGIEGERAMTGWLLTSSFSPAMQMACRTRSMALVASLMVAGVPTLCASPRAARFSHARLTSTGRSVRLAVRQLMTPVFSSSGASLCFSLVWASVRMSSTSASSGSKMALRPFSSAVALALQRKQAH